jgi:hypothetical protein
VALLVSSGLLLAAVFATTPAEAESSKKKDKKPAGGHSGDAPAIGPGMIKGSGAAPTGTRGSMPYGPGYGMGGSKTINKKGPAERKAKSAEPVDPEKLPEDYHVPPEPSDALTTTDEWIEDPFTDRKVKQATLLAQYNTIIASGEFTGKAQEALVADIVRWKLSLLTRKEFREQVQANRDKLLADLKKSPTNPKVGSREVRKFILQTIAKEAPRLFKYHAVARINGAILLAELSDPAYNEADGDGNRRAAEPCIRGIAPLTALVNDKSQLTAPRIWGVIGLVRLAALPELKPVQRNEIVVTLLNRLSDSDQEHEWYQWRLVEGLGKLNIVLNAEKLPVVPKELATVLADTERPLLVRSEAALSLGRLQYTTDINAGLIAYEMALLAQQMADAYGKDPDEAMWKLCFMKVYGGFKPLDADQKYALLTQADRGPLAGYKRTVQEAFDVVLPVVKIVIHKQEGMEAARANLRKWLDSNTPKVFKIHPDLDPIIQEEPIVKKKPLDNGGVDADVSPVANGGSR